MLTCNLHSCSISSLMKHFGAFALRRHITAETLFLSRTSRNPWHRVTAAFRKCRSFAPENLAKTLKNCDKSMNKLKCSLIRSQKQKKKRNKHNYKNKDLRANLTPVSHTPTLPTNAHRFSALCETLFCSDTKKKHDTF